MKSFNWNAPTQYNDPAKRSFHATGRARMRKLATLLGLPAGSYDIRSNAGGIAVSGEVTLHGEDIYVQASQSCIGQGMGILVRTCKGRRDYTGGHNGWLPLELLNDLETLARKVNAVRKLEAIHGH